MLDHLTQPMGQVAQNATFWKHNFKGFCENVVFNFGANLFAIDKGFTAKINTYLNLRSFSSTKPRKKVAHFTPLSPR